MPEWVPGAGFKRWAKKLSKALSRIDNVPFNWAKEKIVSESCWRDTVPIVINFYSDRQLVIMWSRLLRNASKKIRKKKIS